MDIYSRIRPLNRSFEECKLVISHLSHGFVPIFENLARVGVGNHKPSESVSLDDLLAQNS